MLCSCGTALPGATHSNFAFSARHGAPADGMLVVGMVEIGA
jgi:hypothetical protein